MNLPQRLKKNQGRYHGAGLDPWALISECSTLAENHGWTEERIPSQPGLDLRAYRRFAPENQFTLYLSAGIHGDEPAGPLALRELLARDFWPAKTNLILCPCLNPTGFIRNTRENSAGIDLNRDYRHFLSNEVKAHSRWILTLPRINLGLLLHEDWEADGYYVYELNPSGLPSLAPAIIEAVKKVCPIESTGSVDGWKGDGGIVRPNIDPNERPQWPEALYLVQQRAAQSYTLEAPSDFELGVRVDAHVAAVRSVLILLQQPL